MDRLAEILASINADFTGLSDVELRNLRGDLREAALAAREGELTAEVSAAIRTAGEQTQAIKVELAERARAAADIVAEADAALELLDDDEEDGDDENAETTDGDAEAGDEPEEGASAETDTPAEADADAPAEAPEAIAAAAAPPARSQSRRAVKVPARHKPRANRRGPTLIASGEVRGTAPGHEFQNIGEMNEKMFDKWVSIRSAADGVPHHMATIDYRDMFDDDQRLSGGDPFEVSDKVMRFIEGQRNDREALVASGGVPGPAEPRYEQITYGQADRPLRDALPTFLASRGEIIFNQSPTLADITLDTGAGAIGTVTSANDASGATKDIQEISAPSPTTTVVEAETMRWSQGNFADRFYPERTRAFMALGQVAYARHNDALRLADIKTGSTKWTNTPAKFGAYRDLKRQFLGVTEEIEDLVRDFNQSLTVLMPEYVPAMLAADLIAQQAGDGTFNMTEERMRADMQSWDPNVKFVFMKDSIRGRLSVTPSGQSPRSPGFDADVEWAIFPTGAWLFLDGGQLDLGIIRDSVVSATNKFQTFYESWEAVAQLVSLSWWITSSLCSGGGAQAAQNIADCSVQNS